VLQPTAYETEKNVELENWKARTERRTRTELNCHGLVFDELTSGLAGKTAGHWLMYIGLRKRSRVNHRRR